MSLVTCGKTFCDHDHNDERFKCAFVEDAYGTIYSGILTRVGEPRFELVSSVELSVAEELLDSSKASMQP